MGNKFGSCGCRAATSARGYGYSPYSKQMSRNLVRFWAEVFLLAQEGQSVETKWQMVVPKLVPVNVARVQDTPSVISHVTAYNTKVDKVMDTLIYQPGIEVYRGSECFVYWSDPQKGLTWGLNFITPEDASYFMDVVYGGSSLMCRRANSTQSLATKQNRPSKLRSTSSPGTPESSGAHISRKQGGARQQSVKFADTPIFCESSPSPSDMPSVATSATAAGPYGTSEGMQASGQDHLYGSVASSRASQKTPVAASFLSVGASRVDDVGAIYSQPVSSGQVNIHLPSCIRNRDQTVGGYDVPSGQYGPPEPSSSHVTGSDRHRDREAIWKRLDSIAAATEALEPMRISLDSSSLRKMLDPLPGEDTAGSSGQWRPRGPASPSHPSGPSMETQLGPSPSPPHDFTGLPLTTRTTVPPSPSQSAKHKLPLTADPTPELGRSKTSEVTEGVVLRQNDREVPVVSTPSLKRSSIHLVAGKRGQLKSVASGTSRPPDEPERAFAAVNEDDNSLSSSLDESTSSQPISPATRASGGKAQTGFNIRKAGRVSLKQWIAGKDQNIVILTNATWQHYWACIKGFALHFYFMTSAQGEAVNVDSGRVARRSPRRDTQGIEEMKLSEEPALVVDLLNCLAQAVPEYPRRQHVFCLSTGLGHVYLFQVASENELDSWIQALHTHAALASIRNQNRDAAVRSLRKEIEKMEEKIETVAKLIKLSQLPSVGTVSLHQVGDWENELELLHLQHFMAKAYLAAIKGQEMPSCKKVLSAATTSTKNYLSHISAFTLSAMHAFIFARSLPKLASASATPQHQHSASSPLSLTKGRARDPNGNERAGSEGPSGGRMVQSSSSSSDIYSGIVDCTGLARSSTTPAVFKSRASLVQITLCNNQVTVVSVSDMDSVATVLQKACDKAGLRSERCFMLLRKVTSPGESYVPDDMELLQPKIATHQVEIRERLVYHVHLARAEAPDRIFGLTIRAQKQLARGRLTVFVSNVDENGLARRAGLMVGDELLVVNGQCVKSLNSQQVERLLQESQSLCLIMRTKRTALPVCLEAVNCDSSQESLRACGGGGAGGDGVCSLRGGTGGHKQLGLIDEDEEAENWFSDTCGLLRQQMEHHKVKYRHGLRSSLNAHGRQQRYSLPVIPTNALFQQFLQRESSSANASPRHLEQRYSLAGNLEKRISSSEPGDMSSGVMAASLRASGKLGPSEKLEKVLFELVETDRAYVEDMDNMMRTYLEPLRERKLLPAEPLHRLIDASVCVLRFQRSFLEELQEAAGFSPSGGLSFAAPSHLRSALLRVGGVFLNTAARFRLYSSFCAAYFRMQKILKAEEQNAQLQQFLTDCNVQKQHSATLESYLIKPVQRVLRYPLFLQQMRSLTSQGTPEHLQILEALAKMEKVAEYINEMQRVYEEYGAVFAHIQAQCQSREKLNLELSDLLMFGEVGWLNAGEESGKKKQNIGNGPVNCVCFVFKSAILILLLDKGKGKKGKNNHQNLEKTPMFRLIPVTEIEINGSDAGSTDEHYIWILIHIDPVSRAEKVYHFANRRKEIKLQFLRAIRKAGLMLAKEKNGTSVAGTRVVTSERASTSTDTSNGNPMGNHISQIYDDDTADLSSPDSGFPQIGATLPSSLSASWGTTTNGPAVVLRANGVGAGHNARPMSFNSSQSDPGYGSNNEAYKKDANTACVPAQSNGSTSNSTRVLR